MTPTPRDNALYHIVVALRAPVDLPDGTVTTEASIGVSLAEPEQTHADILRHADTAMYAAKTTGTTVTVYTPALDAGRAQRLALLADLSVALERDGLELHRHTDPRKQDQAQREPASLPDHCQDSSS
jgi:predicted signal transduction protein with EAL and GGDEF domain